VHFETSDLQVCAETNRQAHRVWLHARPPTRLPSSLRSQSENVPSPPSNHSTYTAQPADCVNDGSGQITLLPRRLEKNLCPVDSAPDSTTLNQPVLRFTYIYDNTRKPGLRSRYDDWLRAGQPRGQSSIPRRVKNVLFSVLSKPTLGSTQPPIQWETGGFFPRGKAAGAWRWPLTSN
jgi:hypothetical protein